ncbi:hypothetical protein ACUVW2_002589 [Acinetobacter baumannii]|uniref:hypothetical protein n=1 Tax=Acinetobacter baumannii TaxID=470 RepID=UPI0021BDCD5F|nr:hypothetical protein [Acinetobacter baumannii]EHZ7969686.1 hypothetical protein [Acinetobacter baumannii]EKU0974507.1 hypothetical protein [Acinetobacter baumannii]EKU7976147.1 hypothetical protein [Acinetobacter baumannii]EKW1032714.1 hypothetical protein [Acinetobacter baumannii]
MKKILMLLSTIGLSSYSNCAEINLPKIPQVGVSNAVGIIKASGLKPVKTIDSTDSREAAKKIYKFDGVFNQLEFSKNYISITWFQHNKTSLDKAVRLGMATLGKDAGYFIHKVDIQGQHTDYSIQGHRIINSTCISKLCAITIQRN